MRMPSRPGRDSEDECSDEDVAVLADPRRRIVLCELYESAESRSLEEITRRVAAFESRGTRGPVTDGVLERVYDSLSRRHIPALVEHGFLTYDPGEDRIRSTERLDTYLDAKKSPRIAQRRWFRYYGISAVLLLCLVAVRALDIARYSDSLLSSISLLGVGVLLLLPVFHYAEIQRRG